MADLLATIPIFRITARYADGQDSALHQASYTFSTQMRASLRATAQMLSAKKLNFKDLAQGFIGWFRERMSAH